MARSMKQTNNCGPRRHFNYSNVMSTFAVFLAMSGTALALEGTNTVFSDDITDDQVRSADVRNDDLQGGGLGAIDLRAGSVRSAEVANESLTSDDLATNSVDGGEIVTGAVDTDEVEDNGLLGADIRDNTLTGADINESSLGQVPSALLGGFGRTGAESSCDPESTAFVTCGATEVINVPAGARALILARVRARKEVGADHGRGNCRLGTSSIGVVPNTTAFIAADGLGDTATLVGVTPPLPAGTTAFGIDCNQDSASGAIEYDEASASVVLIAAN